MRQPAFNLLIGSPGCGKSTYVSKILRAADRNVCLVKMPQNIDDKAFDWLTEKTLSSWRQGNAPGAPAKFKVAADEDEYKDILQWVMKDFRNGIFVVDDCSMYEENQISKPLKKIIGMRRHIGVDVYLIYHGLTNCPIGQYSFANHVIMFNTADEAGYKANKIPHAARLFRAIDQARQNFQGGSYEPVITKLY